MPAEVPVVSFEPGGIAVAEGDASTRRSITKRTSRTNWILFTVLNEWYEDIRLTNLQRRRWACRVVDNQDTDTEFQWIPAIASSQDDAATGLKF